MPWYGAAYVIAYFALCILGDLYQWRAGMAVPKWWVESLTHLGVGWLLVGYWQEELLAPLGVLAAVFYVYVLLWEVWSTWDDIQSETPDPDSESSDASSGLLNAAVTVVLIGPAYVLAGIAVLR
jgi:hypothetical protein